MTYQNPSRPDGSPRPDAFRSGGRESKFLATAVLATFAFIRAGEFADTLRLCKSLLSHPHDLMHEACGWMLREVGKRDVAALRTFLAQHAAVMPRTMLRYAIEKLPEHERRRYLSLKRERD